MNAAGQKKLKFNKPELNRIKSNLMNQVVPNGIKAKPSARSYDKPWLPPKKEKKEATTFLEYHYPDGIGPDVDLI